MPICLDLSATIYIAIHRFRAVLITRLPSIRPEKGCRVGRTHLLV